MFYHTTSEFSRLNILSDPIVIGILFAYAQKLNFTPRPHFQGADWLIFIIKYSQNNEIQMPMRLNFSLWWPNPEN